MCEFSTASKTILVICFLINIVFNDVHALGDIPNIGSGPQIIFLIKTLILSQ